jgi:hypothetical protein
MKQKIDNDITAYYGHPTVRRQTTDFGSCERSECAWWDEHDKQCVVKNLSCLLGVARGING